MSKSPSWLDTKATNLPSGEIVASLVPSMSVRSLKDARASGFSNGGSVSGEKAPRMAR